MSFLCLHFPIEFMIFPLGLNADLTLNTVPTETPARSMSLWMKLLPSVPQQWALFECHRAIPPPILIQNQNQLDMLSTFIHVIECIVIA